ncbi:MAG: hypothetical protein AOA65_0992 [Candidatus Bathyarchaeota archaeon BA1]|nr:MAG: hypothetical protein AOA65_0992 [Candidatus Bathyarchaeota archaeon BA1]
MRRHAGKLVQVAGEMKMWGYVLGGATMFGVIVGLFSIYNGRATRKVIIEEERRTQEILREHGKILEKLSEQHGAMVEILKSIQTQGK